MSVETAGYYTMRLELDTRSETAERASVLRGIHKALVIYNPTSGRQRGARLGALEAASRALKQAGIAAELAPTTGPGTATDLAGRAVAEKRELVIACGGDGTINEIINGLAQSQVPLAVLPAGTANILAKELGIPWDIPAAARLIAGGTLRRIALGRVTSLASSPKRVDRYFLCVGGAGPDGALVHAVGEKLKQRAGVLAYWAEGIRQLFVYPFPEFHVKAAGRELRGTLLVVGRTKHYGGPFRITTEASLFEDSFELMVNTSSSRLRYLLHLPALWLGRLRNRPGIHHWKATEVECLPASSSTVFAQVDGEPIGAFPLQFQIVPDALTLVLPAAEEPSRAGIPPVSG
jgi:diacylglycerol kinase (ATP)